MKRTKKTNCFSTPKLGRQKSGGVPEKMVPF